ncbi:MAG: thiamine phosphate synthase [Candidatus Eisenbacteria sp.]|nr:thiamine phosphate synthase [Candidatus Eisenbacteria bacterium]
MRRVGRLHILTDTTLQDRYDHEGLARLALEGGSDTIQFRDKSASTRELIRIARGLSEICRRAGVPLIVNDRVDVAMAADAAGVHLGQSDFPISLARQMLGPDRIIGGSATTLEEATEVMWAGADYVGLGPVFGTDSKPDAKVAIGLERLREVAAALEIPVVAIGGIGIPQVSDILATGAHGIALIQAVVLAADPKAATAGLKAAIDAALPGDGTHA